MKNLFLICLISLLSILPTLADQGMWLPNLIGKERIKDMQAKGLKLTAKELYDINNASLKDAIVRFGGGCTGELISDQGLLLTNHHCGYSQIQSHSSLQNDYLTNGFVAKNKAEELSNPGLKVYFLQEMQDVTTDIIGKIKKTELSTIKDSLIKANIKSLVAKYTDPKKGIQATVEPLYYGNQYYLFVYKVYSDVRLVMAPASSIGKFGGDTDNWMWPRHTGDFSMFRVYADENNEPAEYSPENKPFTPKKFFTISTEGVKENDFTFVYGFPGRTQQYLHSAAIDYITNFGNPHKIDLRTKRLEIMNAAQDANPEVRIKYAAKNASVSNAWKKWQGELLGLRRLKTSANKQKLEQQFELWANSKPQYKGVTQKLKELYIEIEPLTFARDYFLEAPLSIELVKFASQYLNPKAKPNYKAFYDDYVMQIDSTTAHYLLAKFIENTPPNMRPADFTDANMLVKQIFSNTIFADSSALKSASREQITSDPLFKIALSLNNKLADINRQFTAINNNITNLYATYMVGLMELRPDYPYFPDANSTLRIAYGKIAGYSPADAVYFKPSSSLDGVMQKDNPAIYDYDVPTKLREIYEKKDFGRWAENGTVPVCFIATNHTTGGNSGSPVLNAHGHLVGINFDRVWEGTMSDLDFDPAVCRNIALDVRYILFNLDKLYDAKYLIDEMKFSN